MRVMTISITITILLSQLLNILSQLLNNSNSGAHYLNIQIIVTRVKLFRSQKEYLEESICKKMRMREVRNWCGICDVYIYIYIYILARKKYINAYNMAQVYKEYHTTYSRS